MKAHGLKRLDKERELHLQAYLNLAVQATKERGKRSYPAYPTFRSFYDHEGHERDFLGLSPKVDEKTKQTNRMKHLVLLANTEGGNT